MWASHCELIVSMPKRRDDLSEDQGTAVSFIHEGRVRRLSRVPSIRRITFKWPCFATNPCCSSAFCLQPGRRSSSASRRSLFRQSVVDRIAVVEGKTDVDCGGFAQLLRACETVMPAVHRVAEKVPPPQCLHFRLGENALLPARSIFREVASMSRSCHSVTLPYLRYVRYLLFISELQFDLANLRIGVISSS